MLPQAERLFNMLNDYFGYSPIENLRVRMHEFMFNMLNT